MKLASLKAGGRDGTLVVVSKDLSKAVAVPSIAPTMQQALDRWDRTAAQLQDVYNKLNKGEKLAGTFDLDTSKLASPLPRAYAWLDGSAYVNHVQLVRKSRGVEMPESFWTDPLMYQGGSDVLLGPNDNIPLADEAFGIDFESEIAVITDDTPMGTPADAAAEHIKLVMLVNDVSLRFVAKEEMKKGFGFVNSKPATAFSPVAVTPDELGDAWKDGKINLPLVTTWNGEVFGKPNAGEDMVFNFPTLVSHAAKTRFLTAGTIVGSGTVSNKDRSVGSSCIVEQRTIETIDTGEASTPFMKFGDTVKIEMKNAAGESIFGAIEQKVVPYAYGNPDALAAKKA